MPAYEIEIILNRQLADCLSIPVFITDTAGNLIFYNEPAENILGKKFNDTGEMPVEVWSTIFSQMDDFGNPISPNDLPLVKTLKHRYPHHKTFWIKNLSSCVKEKISLTAYPIIGRENKFLGAVAIFWKAKEDEN